VVIRKPSSFDLLPAIDLRGGRVVRLRRGSFEREQVYGDDPAAIAAAFRSSGAGWIHVVDLDGARAGERRQRDAVRSVIAAATQPGDSPPVRIQVAGGLRDEAAIAQALDDGATRAVLGTAALRTPTVVEQAIARHGAERIAVALDVRDGLAVGDGWVPGARGMALEDALATSSHLGVSTFVVTAIARDGLLEGPDLGLLRDVVSSGRGSVIASGGISSIADVLAARDLGCDGAVIGRAIYEGTIQLAAAIAAVAEVSSTGPPPRPASGP
jgi:phosphoribosylformimino-5-aminoimidazole carboxamide ribotide isomerase